MRRFDDLIFDIGMNTCEDTDFYLKKGFRVVAVEADPTTCHDAAEKYADAIASRQLTIINRAIAVTRDPTIFYICRTNCAWSTTSSRLRDFWHARGADFQEVMVPGMLARDLVAAYGIPHYAKIDIEGADMLCLDAFPDGASLPAYLSIEVDLGHYRELLQRLHAIGYRRFALIGQLGVVEQRPPLPAREGRYVDYRFEIGPDSSSTGLFGRELPVTWRDDAAAIRRRCRRIIRQYRFSGLLEKFAAHGVTPRRLARAREKYLPLAGDWYDLHAAL
jgi:FkbM family methyltransferase